MSAALLSWGAAGARKLGLVCDVLVVVDVLDFTTRVVAECAAAHEVSVREADGSGAAVALAAAETGADVVAGSLGNAAAVAAAIRDDEVVGFIPCGDLTDDGLLKPALEDVLGVGAIAARLSHRPAAAVVAALRGFERAQQRGLAEAVLATAAARTLLERGSRKLVHAAADLDAHTAVPRLVDGAFRV